MQLTTNTKTHPHNLLKHLSLYSRFHMLIRKSSADEKVSPSQFKLIELMLYVWAFAYARRWYDCDAVSVRLNVLLSMAYYTIGNYTNESCTLEMWVHLHKWLTRQHLECILTSHILSTASLSCLKPQTNGCAIFQTLMKQPMTNIFIPLVERSRRLLDTLFTNRIRPIFSSISKLFK